jgi:hypothetical protein
LLIGGASVNIDEFNKILKFWHIAW